MNLEKDQERASFPETGIFVRAMESEKWGNVDIAHLTPESLLEWLRSGGDNPLAENVVGILMGHGHLHGRGDHDRAA